MENFFAGFYFKLKFFDEKLIDEFYLYFVVVSLMIRTFS